MLGFRFRQGILASLAWLLIPIALGLAFSVAVITLALYSVKSIMVEVTEIIWALLMFFSIGFVPLDQYPRWIQPVVKHQPVSYAIEAMRGLSLGGPVLAPMVEMLLWSVRHRRRLRDTDGDRISKGQHARMISYVVVVTTNRQGV